MQPFASRPQASVRGAARSAAMGILALASVLALILTLSLWRPWESPAPQPRAGAPDAPDSASLHGGGGEPETSAATLAAAGQATANPATERQQVAADTILRGAFAGPAGVRWPGGGRALLLRAGKEIGKGPMGMFSFGMDAVRRRAESRAGGKRDDIKREMMDLIGRGEPVMTTPLDPLGGFVFADPPPGRYQIGLDHRVVLQESLVPVAIEDGATLDVGVLPTRTGSSLLVLVHGAEGQPLQGVRLELGRPIDVRQLMDPSKLGDTTKTVMRMLPFESHTDARGSCAFRGLAAEDAWLLETRAAGYIGDDRMVQLTAGRETVVSIQLQRGSTLRTTVRTAGGTPIADASLRLRIPDIIRPARVTGAPGQEDDRSFQKKGRANADGVIRIRGLPAGRAELRVTAPGYFTKEHSVALPAGDDATVPVDVVLERGETVAGLVVDAETGEPVPKARVLAVPDATEDGSSGLGAFDPSDMMADLVNVQLYEDGVLTAADGAFEIGGLRANAPAKVVAIAGGYDRGELRGVAAGSTGLEVRLTPQVLLHGRVVAAPGGQPVTAFEVALATRAFALFERTMRKREFADSIDGAFTLENVPREKLTLKIEAEGRAPFSQKVDFSEGSVDLGDIELRPPASLSGAVVDEHGAPIADATVRIAQGGAADSLFMAKMLGRTLYHSDDAGQFSIEGLQGGRLRLIADKPGYTTVRSRILRLTAGEETAGVTLTLDRGGSVRGRLVDADGAPLVGWRAQATHTSGIAMTDTTTDALGEFLLTGLLPGTHKIDCMPADYMSRFAGVGAGASTGDGKPVNVMKNIGEAMRYVVSDRATVHAGEETEVELVFEEPTDDLADGPGTVRGTVRLGGRPLKAGMVFFSRLGSLAQARTVTVEDGNFTATGLSPGAYRCRVQGGLLEGSIGTSRVVDVVGSGATTVELELPGGALRGRVVDGTGAPVARVVLILGAPGGSTNDRMDWGEGSTITDRDGSFNFEGLGPGSYELIAKEELGGGRRTARLDTIELGANEVREGLQLTLGGGATLTVHVRQRGATRINGLVTVLDAFGNPLGLFHRTLTDRDGQVAFAGLPAGSYRLAVEAPGAAPQAAGPVWLRDGKETSLDVELRRGVQTTLALRASARGLADETVGYTIRTDDGALVAQGALQLRGLSAGGAPVSLPLTPLAPGRYRLHLEGAALGTHDSEHEVAPGATTAEWKVSL
ncbi:MAG: carboxypeptidase regulatory-like domain-containing protein [Planctomycetota bacterium]